MKKLLYFAFLGVFAFFGCVTADTIDIKWGADNQTYTTTTCTVGGDVILPTPPTKRGYVFRGWQKDVFNRGTFTNWDDVPTTTSAYTPDYHNNSTPTKGDYMVVEDVSTYDDYENIAGYFVIKIHPVGQGNYAEITYEGATTQYPFPANNFSNFIIGPNDTVNLSQGGGMEMKANAKIMIDQNIYRKGDYVLNGGNRWAIHTYTVQFFDTGLLNGTWKFVYDGVWETDGKNGWKPVEQIVNE